MKLHISNGHVIDPANQLDGQYDIFINDGKIVAVSEHYDDFTADQKLDANHTIICPGLIDLNARLDSAGTASIDSETKAASAGGITSLCIPPDTMPIIDGPAAIDLIADRTKKAGQTKVYTIGALTEKLAGQRLSEMLALKEAGCIGISNGSQPIKNTLIQRRAMEYAATLDLTLFINAADPWLQSQGCVHEGVMSTRLGLSGIPETAETIAISRDLLLIEQTNVRAHFHHLSSATAVQMIADAKKRGLPVTADVGIHHLYLSEHDIANYNTLSHIIPPLRSTDDREKLRQGMRDGVISAICSNHRPLNNDAKLGPFSETTPGMSGLDTLLPLTMKLVADDALSIQQAIASLTCQPATILNIEAGNLSAGAQADICIIDPHAHYECQPENFTSSGKNSPLKGWLFSHQVIHTLIDGQFSFSLHVDT